MTRQLAKIYYEQREVKYINIKLNDSDPDSERTIYIGGATHISGKHEIIHLSYELTKHEDDGEDEFSVVDWEVKNHLDKIETNHDNSGLMIKWLSPSGSIESSLFVPWTRIDHISVDNPESADKPEHKETIPR